MIQMCFYFGFICVSVWSSLYWFSSLSFISVFASWVIIICALELVALDCVHLYLSFTFLPTSFSPSQLFSYLLISPLPLLPQPTVTMSQYLHSLPALAFHPTKKYIQYGHKRLQMSTQHASRIFTHDIWNIISNQLLLPSRNFANVIEHKGDVAMAIYFNSVFVRMALFMLYWLSQSPDIWEVNSRLFLKALKFTFTYFFNLIRRNLNEHTVDIPV